MLRPSFYKKKRKVSTSVIPVLLVVFVIAIGSCSKIEKVTDLSGIHIACKTGGSTDYNFFVVPDSNDVIRYRNERLFLSEGDWFPSIMIDLVDSPILAKDYVLNDGLSSAPVNTFFINLTFIPVDDGYISGTNSGRVTITQIDTTRRTVRGKFSGTFKSKSNAGELLTVSDGSFYVNYLQY